VGGRTIDRTVGETNLNAKGGPNIRRLFWRVSGGEESYSGRLNSFETPHATVAGVSEPKPGNVQIAICWSSRGVYVDTWWLSINWGHDGPRKHL